MPPHQLAMSPQHQLLQGGMSAHVPAPLLAGPGGGEIQSLPPTLAPPQQQPAPQIQQPAPQIQQPAGVHIQQPTGVHIQQPAPQIQQPTGVQTQQPTGVQLHVQPGVPSHAMQAQLGFAWEEEQHIQQQLASLEQQHHQLLLKQQQLAHLQQQQRQIHQQLQQQQQQPAPQMAANAALPTNVRLPVGSDANGTAWQPGYEPVASAARAQWLPTNSAKGDTPLCRPFPTRGNPDPPKRPESCTGPVLSLTGYRAAPPAPSKPARQRCATTSAR